MSKPIFEDNFKFSGRRNRKSYFLYGLAIMFVFIILSLVIIAAVPDDFIGNNGRGPMQFYLSGISPILAILVGLIGIPVLISIWAVTAQRCRDFGWTGWAALITLIPYLGFIFSLALLFIPGTQGENRYGPDPLG